MGTYIIQLHTKCNIHSFVVTYGCETKSLRNILQGRHGVNVILKTFPSQKLHTFEQLAYIRQHPVSFGSINPTSEIVCPPFCDYSLQKTESTGLGLTPM